MPYKDKAKDAACKKKWNQEHRLESRVYSRLLRKELNDLVKEAKDKPCADCGIKYPHFVMDFDHIPGQEKVDNVAHLIRKGTKMQIQKEIEKCEVVCSNCHRIRTHARAMQSLMVQSASFAPAYITLNLLP